MTARSLCWLALLIAALSVSPSWAQDSDRSRYYLHLRGHGSSPVTDVHDMLGASVGFNFNRYWGAEFAVDGFERRLRVNGLALGEYLVVPLVPQVRFRYPVLDGRLTPYVLGGVGAALTEFNDRKRPGFGVSVDAPSSTVVGVIGGGFEYFLAENVAAGVEIKYVIAGEQTVRINGVARSEDLDSLYSSFGLRLFFPEGKPAPPRDRPDGIPARFYIGAQAGAAILTDADSMPGVELHPEPAALGPANYFIGGVIGADLGRHFGFELLGGGYEVRVHAPGLGSVGEEAVYAIIPQVRARYPVLDGRLIPYVIAGVGAGYVEFNDRKRRGLGFEIDATNWGVAATVGAGLEYLVASNIGAAVEARYLTSRGHTIKIADGKTETAHVDAVLLTVGLRIYLFDVRF
ncbi:MAG TPA: outer membrane beta-barrel protein [Methylomirabilota bacterium]|jgi:opacity protein-like surface antigen